MCFLNFPPKKCGRQAPVSKEAFSWYAKRYKYFENFQNIAVVRKETIFIYL
jgi:hypothetical protein